MLLVNIFYPHRLELFIPVIVRCRAPRLRKYVEVRIVIAKSEWDILTNRYSGTVIFHTCTTTSPAQFQCNASCDGRERCFLEAPSSCLSCLLTETWCNAVQQAAIRIDASPGSRLVYVIHPSNFYFIFDHGITHYNEGSSNDRQNIQNISKIRRSYTMVDPGGGGCSTREGETGDDRDRVMLLTSPAPARF